MTSFRAGELVTVAGERAERDGIVFSVTSSAKVVVAVQDAKRGAVLRTVDVGTLSARDAAGPDDAALNRLIRRTPPPGGGAFQHAGGAGQARRGHSRAPAHRAPGK